MKKLVIASALALSVFAASATEVGVASVYDTTTQRFGVRASAELPTFSGFAIAPQLSVTEVKDLYTRYAVGTSFDVYKLNAVTVSVNGGGLYQDSSRVKSGYALYAGAKVSYAVTKNLNVNAGVERVFGQDRLDTSTGNIATVGATLKF